MQPKDLHDFEDVAQNYDLYLDVMYKNEEKPNGFPDFYLDFAKAYGQDGVIDIACGTGAVLLYLAQHGIRADGTDLSEAMCRVADRKAKQMQTSDTDYAFRLAYINSQGKQEKIYNAISYDPFTQIMRGNWKFETLDENGNVTEERVRPLKMRQTYRQEMKYLLELTGFEIVNVYGGYDREAADHASGNVIWCVKKA